MNVDRRSIFARFLRSVLPLSLIFLSTASLPGVNLLTSLDRVSTSDLASVFPDRPPVIDGKVLAGEWSAADSTTVNGGTLFVQNDVSNLYFFYDLPHDTQYAKVNYALTVSIAKIDSEKINPNDKAADQFIFEHEGNASCLSRHGAHSQFENCGSPVSQAAGGFGTTTLGQSPHLFWEESISLPEISATVSDSVELCVQSSPVQAGVDLKQLAGAGSNCPQIVKVQLARPQFKLLVLANTDFLGALEPLRIHKDETGMPAYVQSWQSLARSYHAQGADDAERIKLAIADYQRFAGIKYVMLVGDAGHFPVRYAITDHDNENNHGGWTFIPSDYYYADLYQPGGKAINTWDANRDGYFGELDTQDSPDRVNVDGTGLAPTLAVGRVPAASAAEVTTYVNKVMRYESSAYQAGWAKSALFISTTDWVPPACQTANKIAGADLAPEGYRIMKLFQAGNPCENTDAPTPAAIIDRLNQGTGFVSYFGHAAHQGWMIPGEAFDSGDLPVLTETQRLPVVFTTGCNSGRIGGLLPEEAYVDVNGVHHPAQNPRQRITGKPPQPANIQPAEQAASFGEQLLVSHSTGAVAYLGAGTSSQYPAYDLARYFFGSLKGRAATLGDMWSGMIAQYYAALSPSRLADAPAWYRAALFQQPWKFNLLGDPSLRIGGVPAN